MRSKVFKHSEQRKHSVKSRTSHIMTVNWGALAVRVGLHQTHRVSGEMYVGMIFAHYELYAYI